VVSGQGESRQAGLADGGPGHLSIERLDRAREGAGTRSDLWTHGSLDKLTRDSTVKWKKEKGTGERGKKGRKKKKKDKRVMREDDEGK
jgi:hypothetical protein